MIKSRISQFDIVINLIAAVAYALSALAAGALTVAPTTLSLVWNPAGIGLGAVYLYGIRIVPGLVIGMVVSELYLTSSSEDLVSPVSVSVMLTLAGSLQAVLGATLLRHVLGDRCGFTNAEEVLRFLFFGAVIAGLIAPTIGVAFFWWTNNLPTDSGLTMWATWWLGDALGIAIVVPLTIAMFSPDRATWTRRRRLAVVLPSLILLSLMTTFHWFANQQEIRRLELVFDRLTNVVESRLSRELHSAEDVVLTLKSFFESRDSTSSEQFSQFVSPLLARQESIQALEWIPRISDADRDNGFIGSLALPPIREPDTARKMVSAQRREEYFPVVFVEPIAGNERAMGFDVATNPRAAQALILAEQTGEIATSGPIQLVQDRNMQFGFVLYAPIKDTRDTGNRAAHGFGAAVFRVNEIMQSIAPDTIAEELLLTVVDSGENIYASPTMGSASTQVVFERTSSYPVAERQWTVTMKTGPAFFANHFRWETWWMHAVGFSLTALLTAMLTVLTGRSLVIERVVRERTGELNSAVRQLDAHNEILRGVAAADLPIDSMIRHIVERLEWAYPGVRFSVSLFAGDHRTIEQTISASLPRPFVRALCGAQLPPCNQAGLEELTLSPNDLSDAPTWREPLTLLQDMSVTSALWQPLGSSELLGILGVYICETDPPFTINHVIDDSTKLLTLALDRHRVMANIRRLAFFDSLTGIPNRERAIGRLQEEMAFCEHNNCYSAVLLVDVDDLKDVNDSLGHREGDRLLCEVAIRLSSVCRENDLAARLSGDEFLVVIAARQPDVDTLEQTIRKVFESIRARLSRPLQLHDYDHNVSISVGASLIPQPGFDASTVIQQADTAMYRAKSQGKNNLCLYQAEMKALAHEQFDIAKGLEDALKENSLELYFQFQHDVKSQPTAAEALLRWHHPERGMLAAREFIEVAERTSLIIRIGTWVVEQACAVLEANEWLEYIAVNISPRHLQRDEFVGQILEQVERFEIAPSRLVLEITEHTLIENLADNLDKLRALREAGVRIAMDDFGTGYSSLFYIRQLPLSQIKIDKVFIAGVLENPHDAFIVGSIITLADQMGVDFVAEGVETKEQFEFLKSRGCKRFQGYLFSRPEAASDLLRLTANTS